MSVINKRIVAFIATVFMFVGLRLSDNGLAGFIQDGSYTVFDRYDRAVTYDTVPVLCRRGVYERIDVAGSEKDAYALLTRMNASVLETEKIEGITIIYAFCPRLSSSAETGFGKVNVMIALSNGKMTVGSPLIKGSY